MGIFSFGNSEPDDDEDDGQSVSGGSFHWGGQGGSSSYSLNFGNVTGSRFTIGDDVEEDD